MMKKIHYLLLLLSAAAGMACFAACSKDDPDVPGDDDIVVEIGEYEYYTPEQVADEVFGPEGSNADETMVQAREQFLALAKKKEAELQEELGTNGLALEYISCRFKYYSQDVDGGSIPLTGRIAWGGYWLFGHHNLDPDNIYLFEHYTITSNAECPSEDGSTECFLATGDNLLIMPDYIGYGSTKHMVHPYLNHEITAINSIDALKAGYKVWKEKGSGTMEDDWKLYVLGSSQGANNALAVHKYLDTHEELAKEWRFAYSYSCCGAYDPALTMDTYYKWGKTAYIGSIPMTIKSMMVSYPDILSGFKEEDFYCEKYLKIKSQVDAILEQKKTNTTDLNHKMKELLETQDPKLEDILSADALNKESELCKAFFKCLEKNNLTVGWTPKHQIKIWCTKGDDIVPCANTEAVKNAFGDKVTVTWDFWERSHVNFCTAWYLSIPLTNW